MHTMNTKANNATTFWLCNIPLNSFTAKHSLAMIIDSFSGTYFVPNPVNILVVNKKYKVKIFHSFYSIGSRKSHLCIDLPKYYQNTTTEGVCRERRLISVLHVELQEKLKWGYFTIFLLIPISSTYYSYYSNPFNNNSTDSHPTEASDLTAQKNHKRFTHAETMTIQGIADKKSDPAS